MKILALIRHGKSSWADAHIPDRERPLKKRGVQDAQLMATLLRRQKIFPDGIFSSPAKRAYDTAKIIAGPTAFDEGKIRTDQRLYFEGVENIFNAMHGFDEKVKVAFLFGHNPEFTEFVNLFMLTGIEKLPTCGVAVIQFSVKTWREAAAENGKLIFYDFPKNHR